MPPPRRVVIGHVEAGFGEPEIPIGQCRWRRTLHKFRYFRDSLGQCLTMRGLELVYRQNAQPDAHAANISELELIGNPYERLGSTSPRLHLNAMISECKVLWCTRWTSPSLYCALRPERVHEQLENFGLADESLLGLFGEGTRS